MSGEPHPLSDLDLSALRPDRIALFLDFDGTLADFADDPAAVRLLQSEHDAIAAIRQATGGALAVVSGRDIRDLDRLLAPLVLPLAGVHGLQRRDSEGRLIEAQTNRRILDRAAGRLARLADAHAGLIVERKPGSVAIHFRRRPELEALVTAVARAVVGEQNSLQPLHGKMVIELKLGHVTKADAIKAFMQERPFAGREPFFAGDDVTDEQAFAVLPELHGTAIKVGPGATAARFRAPTIDAFRDWLWRLARQFSQSTITGGVS